ncbi:MAG TPA: carboxypeptidase-like regulatory domain-containing protein, partial [Vicinamibacterales bacterium]|nr:carboxypeptidase-like regulatory domain-containing protein [Vicinamibacterales bacterium]
MILLLTASAVWAQATAQMSGAVRDESGAVLPGVTVTVTQVDTGATRTAVTDETGAYLLPNLPTGPYRLQVSLQGFRTYEQTGIVLQVGATPVINAVLAVGNVEETVSVEGAAPLVDVRSSGISNVVENERILELPLQGRQVTDLLVLAGAAVQTGTPARGVPGGVNIAVAGGLPFGVAYTLDGATHNNPQSNTNLPLPFPDALQEFRVSTSGLSAENGMHSGASVSAVTRSGTNRFAGTVFEFVRDRHFNATSPFAAIGPDGKRVDDGLKRNQFGGTLGGPILRDKLFFFGAYQGTLRRQLPADNIMFVPTPQMVSGDFTAFAAPACNGGRQINLTGPFSGNRINPALFSPAALNLVKRLPVTTDPCGQTTYASSENQDEHQPVVRVDYQLSQKQSIFGRYLGTRI